MSSFEAKNKKIFREENIDKEIDNTESSSINLNFNNKRKKIKDNGLNTFTKQKFLYL